MSKKSVRYFAAFKDETLLAAMNSYGGTPGRASLKKAIDDTLNTTWTENGGKREPGSFVYKVTIERVAKQEGGR